VARSDKECWKIYGEIQFMSENKKQDRGTSREINDKWSIREGINAPNSGLYHEVTISGRKEHNFGSM